MLGRATLLGVCLLTTVLATGVGGCGRRLVAAAPGQRLVTLPGHATAAALPVTTLDLLVWNVHKTRASDWLDDFERLAAAADLVLLQEAYDRPLLRAGIHTRPDMDWQLGVSFRYARRDHAATGVATGSVAPARRSWVMYAPAREPWSGTPKLALVSTFPLHGRRDALLVINVHAINFRRAKHLGDQLRQLSAAIDEHEGPVIMAGDFNTHHRPRLQVLERFASEHGLRAVLPNWGRGTRRRRPVADGRTRFGRWPLDHVYVRGLHATATRVSVDTEGSDHRPLEIQLELDPPT
ncbi:MAG: endonuclease/exonuclease/phosphatase family protein [Nannocystaceae bacterium]